MSAHPPKHSRAASFGYIILAYVVAIAAAYVTVTYFPLASPLYTAFLADFVATCAVFAPDSRSFYVGTTRGVVLRFGIS